MRAINLADKFSQFSDYYSPKIAGELNDSYVKVVKLKGDFIWHHHDAEDELFLIVKGTLRMGIREDGREREETVRAGEFIIIPRGVEPSPRSRRGSPPDVAGGEDHAQHRQCARREDERKAGLDLAIAELKKHDQFTANSAIPKLENLQVDR